MQVLVRDNNVDQALRVLKKKMQREGIFREMKARKAYEKPSERKTREKATEVLHKARESFVRKRRAMAEQMTPAGAASAHFTPAFVDLQAAIEARLLWGFGVVGLGSAFGGHLV